MICCGLRRACYTMWLFDYLVWLLAWWFVCFVCWCVLIVFGDQFTLCFNLFGNGFGWWVLLGVGFVGFGLLLILFCLLGLTCCALANLVF